MQYTRWTKAEKKTADAKKPVGRLKKVTGKKNQQDPGSSFPRREGRIAGLKKAGLCHSQVNNSWTNKGGGKRFGEITGFLS